MVTQDEINEMHMQYRRLISGEAVSVVIDQNGERLEYSKGNAQLLWSYIRLKEDELAATLNKGRKNRPLTFTY